MRLVASPVLSEDDINAIESGYLQRDEAIARAVEREFNPASAPDPVQERLGFLAWMIQENLLEIKLAVVESAGKLGIYHEKVGIFEDEDDNVVVFVGSANESLGGYVSNFETFDVFCSWRSEDSDRVADRMQDFEALWADLTPSLRVLSFPRAAKEKLLEVRPTHLPKRDPDEKPDDGDGKDRTRPGITGWGAPTKPDGLELRKYQQKAVAAWLGADGRGSWRMATGTGKTINALSAITQVHKLLGKYGTGLGVVVVAPLRHLVSQWASEARRFGIDPLQCMGTKRAWAGMLSDGFAGVENGYHKFFMAIVTNDSFRSDEFQSVIRGFSGRLMLVADEMHNLGAPALLAQLPENALYRLGLSATPERWYDEAGTAALVDYFGGIVYQLDIDEAIGLGALCHYNYFPQVVHLGDDELESYIEISKKIAQLVGRSGVDSGEFKDSPQLSALMIKRARILAVAGDKLRRLREVAVELKNSSHNLFYCGDGQVERVSMESQRQLDAVVHLVGREIGMRVNSYTADTPLETREDLRDRFASGDLQGIVAIRCLDEGVDIPATRRALILASSSNPRQFIQRRGRVLRPSPGKDVAEIHDFVVAPTAEDLGDEVFNIERRLFARELQRVVEFASIADNGPQAMAQLLSLRQEYNLLDVG